MTLFKTTCESDFKSLIFTLTCAEFFLEVDIKLCFEVPLLLKIAITMYSLDYIQNMALTS